ncbi:hypothetical protein [Paraclostridium bifermentans]
MRTNTKPCVEVTRTITNNKTKQSYDVTTRISKEGVSHKLSKDLNTKRR